MSAVPHDMPRPMMVDWPTIFAELKAHGLSSYQINRRTGQSRSALRDYAAGISQPRHHVGEIILLVWTRETGKGRDAVPYVSSYFNQPVMI